MHKVVNCNLIELRKEFPCNSSFVQTIVILHNLGIFNVYKQAKNCTDLFDAEMTDQTDGDVEREPDNSKDFSWFYCVELKDFTQPQFDAE